MTDENQFMPDANDFVWIDSNGGPLILLSRERLVDWEGIKIPTGNRQVQARFRWLGPDSPATDYDRAADVEGYLGRIKVGAGWALVLGGEPMSTGWLPNRIETAGVLLRWEDGEDEARVFSSLSEIPHDLWQPATFGFQVGQQPLYLFDAAYPGAELDRFLEVRLEAGVYSVATALFRPDEDTSLVVHRLRLQ